MRKLLTVLLAALLIAQAGMFTGLQTLREKTSKKIKGLASKHTYYVRIHAYKDAADGRHVSAWRVKKVKVK